MNEQAEPAVDPAGEIDEYAMVEIFGHRRHAGRVAEVERFGAKLLRVDVPKGGDFANGWTTHFYGGSAIFSMTPTSKVEKFNQPYRPAGLLTSNHQDGDDEDRF
jgi:hypothetical protein